MADDAVHENELWQMENIDYIDRLIEAAHASPLHAGAELRTDAQEVTLYGVGQPSDGLVTIMNEAPPNVRVVWCEAPYTLTELSSEVERILTQQPAGLLNSCGSQTDGTGLKFTTTEPELLGAEDPQAALGARFPVSLEYGGPAMPA